jgi:glycosyltransferase involved in cell wall biosynthesis
MPSRIKLSVIIPVFNTIEYLDECILSLINQRLIDIELIFIDNGSDDGSYEKLKAIEAEKNSSFFRVFQVTVGGCGHCRNYGIQLAKGEHIGFCDSDDWCSGDMFERLLNAAVDFDADIAIGEIIRWNPKKGVLSPYFGEKYFKSGFYSPAERPFLIKMTNCYNKIYKKELLISNNIYFQDLPLHEDVTFTFKALYLANKIVSVPEARYFYRHNLNSITQIAEKQSEPGDAVFKMIKKLRAECSALNVPYEWVMAAERLIESHLIWVIENVKPEKIAAYLDRALEAAEYLPKSVFKNMAVTPSKATLGEGVYNYYLTQKQFAPQSN